MLNAQLCCLTNMQDSIFAQPLAARQGNVQECTL